MFLYFRYGRMRQFKSLTCGGKRHVCSDCSVITKEDQVKSLTDQFCPSRDVDVAIALDKFFKRRYGKLRSQTDQSKIKPHVLFSKNHAFVPWRSFEVQVRRRLGFMWYEGLHYLAQEAWTILEEQVRGCYYYYY